MFASGNTSPFKYCRRSKLCLYGALVAQMLLVFFFSSVIYVLESESTGPLAKEVQKHRSVQKKQGALSLAMTFKKMNR